MSKPVNKCEEYVKRHLEQNEDLVDILALPSHEQEFGGIKIKQFMPVKVVVGMQHIMGIVIRATKQNITLLDGIGRQQVIKISKISMLVKITCDEFLRHAFMYRLKWKEKGEE